MRYMEGYKTLPTWLENSHSFFSASFLLAKESETFSGQLLQSLIPVIFWIFSPELVGCFVKIIRNDQRPNVASTPPIYKTPWQEKESRKFWPVTNSVQWFILHSHKMMMCEMNGNYDPESKNVEIPVDQIGQYTKNNCFSETMFKMS